MAPCYVVTYYLQGDCAVDANAVTHCEDEMVDGFNRCRLYFNNGSELRLEEDCDAFNAKREDCRPDYPEGLPVFPGEAS